MKYKMKEELLEKLDNRPQEKCIIINASHNKDGKVAKLCERYKTRIVDLVDGIDEAIEEILKADSVIFATPVHWFNVSSLMKELIDKLPEAPDFPCEGKKAYFFAVCEEDGGQQAINQMFAPLNHMGFIIPPYACHFYNLKSHNDSELNWQNDFTQPFVLKELLVTLKR